MCHVCHVCMHGHTCVCMHSDTNAFTHAYTHVLHTMFFCQILYFSLRWKLIFLPSLLPDSHTRGPGTQYRFQDNGPPPGKVNPSTAEGSGRTTHPCPGGHFLRNVSLLDPLHQAVQAPRGDVRFHDYAPRRFAGFLLCTTATYNSLQSSQCMERRCKHSTLRIFGRNHVFQF